MDMDIEEILNDITVLFNLQDKINIEYSNSNSNLKKHQIKKIFKIKIKSNYNNQFLVDSEMYKKLFKRLQKKEKVILNQFNDFLCNKNNFKKYLDNSKYLEDILSEFKQSVKIELNDKIKEKIHKFIIYLLELDYEEEIESKWQIYKRKQRKQKQKQESNINVKITDSTTKAKLIIYLSIPKQINENKIYYIHTQSGEIIGHVSEFKDDTIPKKFKFNNNSIRNPYNGLPVYEYNFDPTKKGIYHDLPKSSYREYSYNSQLNRLVSTHEIDMLS